MRRGRIFFLLAFLLILGLVGVGAVWFLLGRGLGGEEVAQDVTPTPPPVEVVIITQNIPQGYILDEDVLTSIPTQVELVAPGMFTSSNITELIGRQVKYEVSAGTPLLDTMLLKAGEQIPQSGSPWAINIPTGMVAVSIPINKLSSISYAPRPGDHVNVISSFLFVDIDTDFQTNTPSQTGVVIASGPADPVTGTRDPLTVEIASGLYGKTLIDPVLGQAVFIYPSEAQRPRMVSQMLLQDVIVLQVGEFPQDSNTDTDVITSEGEEGQEEQSQEQEVSTTVPKPSEITLIVRPQDAVTLNYIMYAQTHLAAQLSLVLRSPTDNSREDILPVTLQFLLEQYEIPVPSRLPYSLNPRIDYLVPPSVPVNMVSSEPEQ
jgi:Flp pilus assembly protein CpaB